MSARGLTLLELMVTLTVMALIAGIAATALPPATNSPASSPPESLRARARREAVASGRAITFTDTIRGTPHTVTAFPDGRVVSEPQASDAQR